MKMENFPTNVH